MQQDKKDSFDFIPRRDLVLFRLLQKQFSRNNSGTSILKWVEIRQNVNDTNDIGDSGSSMALVEKQSWPRQTAHFQEITANDFKSVSGQFNLWEIHNVSIENLIPNVRHTRKAPVDTVSIISWVQFLFFGQWHPLPSIYRWVTFFSVLW